MSAPLWLWIAFNVFVLVMLGIDLGLVQRKAHAVTSKEAGIWTVVWILLSLAFCGFISQKFGQQKALEFLTGYVVEYSLSVDNLFVFLMVFGYFRVKPEYQHRLLFWGILGAFVMRAALILVGSALVTRFHFLLYIFGAFLLYTAWKMLFADEHGVDPEHNKVLVLARKVLPVAQGDHGSAFFVKQNGKTLVTTMFLILIVVETTDLLFALDSIPAILGITQDPFIVYTSNVCAILGLRSLFFVVASLMSKFHYLKVGLAAVLAFVGVKMLTEGFIPLSAQTKIVISLGVIVAILATSIIASILKPAKPHLVPPSEEAIAEREGEEIAQATSKKKTHP